MNEKINKINDNWFNEGSFETFKNPIVEKYELTTKSGIVETLEGNVNYEAGHYIMTGPKEEKYPISPEKFKSIKDDHGNGTCSPKKIIKLAKLADHDGVIYTKWGVLQYNTDKDYIINHGSNDYGVVKSDIFRITYDQSNVK